MRIRTDTKGRDETLRMLMQATDENTKTKAIFLAVEHYLNDKRNKERVADDLPRDLLDELSTPELPLERGETRVGPFDE
jgi:hypothetical protein